MHYISWHILPCTVCATDTDDISNHTACLGAAVTVNNVQD